MSVSQSNDHQKPKFLLFSPMLSTNTTDTFADLQIYISEGFSIHGQCLRRHHTGMTAPPHEDDLRRTGTLPEAFSVALPAFFHPASFIHTGWSNASLAHSF